MAGIVKDSAGTGRGKFGTVWFEILFVVVTLLFALLFRYVPDEHVTWKDVWIGAAATAILFDLGKFLIGFYIGETSIGSMFGAAGSVVVILAWV